MRGVIQNRDRSTQIKDCSQLRFNNITPSDVDNFIEFKNKLCVLIEYKLGNAPIPEGQRIGLSRMADAMSRGGLPCYVILCSHDAYDPEDDIQTHASIVKEIRYNDKWLKQRNPRTLKEVIEKLLEKHGVSVKIDHDKRIFSETLSEW